MHRSLRPLVLLFRWLRPTGPVLSLPVLSLPALLVGGVSVPALVQPARAFVRLLDGCARFRLPPGEETPENPRMEQSEQRRRLLLRTPDAYRLTAALIQWCEAAALTTLPSRPA